jgi:hypothetical protein
VALTGLLGAVLITARPSPVGMTSTAASPASTSGATDWPLAAPLIVMDKQLPRVAQPDATPVGMPREQQLPVERGAVVDGQPMAPDLQLPPRLPLPDIPNPFDAFDRLSPTTLANDLLDALLTAIGGALLGAVRGVVDWALGLGDSSLNIVTQTPAEGTYESPTVRSMWDFSRALANAALALVVMWGGFGVNVKEQTRTPYHDLMELLPRVALAAVGANLTLIFAALLIDANNTPAGEAGTRPRGLRAPPGAGAHTPGAPLLHRRPRQGCRERAPGRPPAELRDPVPPLAALVGKRAAAGAGRGTAALLPLRGGGAGAGRLRRGRAPPRRAGAR